MFVPVGARRITRIERYATGCSYGCQFGYPDDDRYSQERELPVGIDVRGRVVVAVCVSVKVLRISRVRDYGVRADEPTDLGIVISGIVVVKTCLVKQGFVRSSVIVAAEQE